MQDTGIQSLVSEDSPGEGNSNPLQYSCLENPHRQRSLGDYSPWGCRVSHDWARSQSWAGETQELNLTNVCILFLPGPKFSLRSETHFWEMCKYHCRLLSDMFVAFLLLISFSGSLLTCARLEREKKGETGNFLILSALEASPGMATSLQLQILQKQPWQPSF